MDLNTNSGFNPVTQAALDKKIDQLEKTLERLAKPVWAVAIGIIVVLFLGFVATLVAMMALVEESNNFKMSAYQQLNGKLDTFQKDQAPKSFILK
jgi:hypothetical protein